LFAYLFVEYIEIKNNKPDFLEVKYDKSAKTVCKLHNLASQNGRVRVSANIEGRCNAAGFSTISV